MQKQVKGGNGVMRWRQENLFQGGPAGGDGGRGGFFSRGV